MIGNYYSKTTRFKMKEKKNIIKGKYMNYIAHIAVKSKAACHLRDWNFALHLSGHQKSYVKVNSL